MPQPPAELTGSGPLRLDRDGPLVVLTMDSPPGNVFDHAMLSIWAVAVKWLGANPPRAVLVRAEGRVVSTGVDISVFAELPPDQAGAFWARQLATTQGLERLPCPTVFAAHSLTLTAAFELALACDLIVSTAAARFGLVERKIGFTPAMGGTQRLAAKAGTGRAAELVLTGALYRGERLAEWGVVNALFDSATFHQDAYDYAKRLATGPTRAHAATKTVIRAVRTGGVAEADTILPAVIDNVVRTADHHSAVAAFATQGPDHDTDYTG